LPYPGTIIAIIAMTSIFPQTYPFWLHALIELPASLNFYYRPDEQLSSPAPQAHPIIRQYAVLLLVTVLIASIFALRPVDNTSRNVAVSLAVYHVAPVMRALSRIVREANYGFAFGGPWMHLAVHGVCLVSLIRLYFSRG